MVVVKWISGPEIKERQHFNNSDLFDFCCKGEHPASRYQFEISTVTRAFVDSSYNLLNEDHILAFKGIELLHIDVGASFIERAFLDQYAYDSRLNFLNYQFENTKYPQTFLNQVIFLLQNVNWKSPAHGHPNKHLIEEEVNKWVEQKRTELEKQNLPPQSNEPSGLTLKSQFINPDKYEEVINKLVQNGNLRKDTAGNLIFIKGHIRGTKYGVEALRMALNELGYLINQQTHTTEVLKEIHRNTFKDFIPSDKTINPTKKDGFLKSLGYFKAILS